MQKKAKVVAYLVLLGLSGIFSIEVFADSYIDARIQNDYDQISQDEAAGALRPNEAETLRYELENIQQDETNALLSMFPDRRQEIINEVAQAEQDIQNAEH